MIQNSKTWSQLTALRMVYLPYSWLDKAGLDKARDTTKYSLRKDDSQNAEEVATRCLIATMAEKYIADVTGGFMLGGEEDYSNPYSFAFDVVSGEGVRIEVKTHQSDSKWISVHTGQDGYYPNGYGINLGPFMDHRVADVLVMFDVKATYGGIELLPKFIAGPSAFDPESGFVQKSRGDGWYLRSCSKEYPYHRFTR